ncbi:MULTISPECIES: chaperone NapD [Providencia]|uniref:Chaperone NapD n=1 Tax=Providencia rettgeri TaxID=587 RepID=A0AAD2VW21_PRORE|nr:MULTISPECIES: chaperone NapD [Providencia]ELR5073015.1 chaperone NapD [Providencia stuartii]ELR5071022.1 chaperone NapD [Providencia rettgeri]ELR5218113.1 chaperone NapD [Providencia rettgeri]ELR5219915.1 chaperone NapD [Providencia rettgeri]ELR5221749.1 chaperone NapD [Providencia rettgeri]
MHSNYQVCSLIVQVKSERLSTVAEEINQLSHCEVAISAPENGKLIVVVEGQGSRTLLDTIDLVRDIDGVLDVSLVYHQQEEQGEEDYETQSS